MRPRRRARTDPSWPSSSPRKSRTSRSTPLFLANKIVALGGEPTTTPRPVPEASTNREMLEAILAAERQAGADYAERAQQADDYGDKGLVVALEDMVRDETGHAEETERMLRDWPL